jgi:hypothetical protein
VINGTIEKKITIWNVATVAMISVLKRVLQNRVLKIIRCKPVRFSTISWYDFGIIPLSVGKGS